MNTEVVDVLRHMRDRLEKPWQWTKHKLARDSRGEPVSPGDNYAVCWCLLGARSVECGHNTALAADVATALGGAIIRTPSNKEYQQFWGGPPVGAWNDEHSHSEMLELLDSAISFEEAK